MNDRLRLVMLASLCAGTLLLAGAGLRAQSPGDEAVRPFDKVDLKNGKSIVGTIDPPVELATATEVVINISKGGTIKLKRSDVESITPRQTPEDAYRKIKKRVGAVHEPEARAKEELKLGLWCKTPLPELDGAMPRESAALGHLLSAIELDPKLAEAYPHVVALLAASPGGGSGSPADIDREARVAILAEKGGYSDPEIDFRIGSLLAERLNLPGKAKTYLERVLAAGHKNLGQLKTARALLSRIYAEEGAPEKAIVLYEAMIAQPDTAPGNFEAFYELGKLQARQGSLEGSRAAKEYFTKALAIQPEFLEIQAELAALDYRAGNLPAAEKTLKALIAKDTANIAALIDLALVRVRTGRFALAEKDLKALVPQAEGADKARASMGLALLRENRGDDLNALSLYRDALAADPGSMEAKLSVAAILIRQGQAGDGRSIAEELLPRSKTNPWLFAACSRLLGEADLAEGKADSALQHLLRAVEVDSRDPALLERVGALLLRQGKLDGGFQMLLRARQSGGERADTMNAMAYYHYTRGEVAMAKQIFESVLTLVKAPPRPSGRDAKTIPVPPARLYALRGKDLIGDLARLEVWSADFTGADAAVVDGWEETERYGIDISRKSSHIVLAGKQASSADGVTTVMLDRPVDAPSFDRVTAGARVESGKARLGLRMEGFSAKGGASTGLIFYKDYDNVLRAQVKTATGDWEAVPRTDDVPPDGGKLSNPETTAWPSDSAYHLLEIRVAGTSSATGATTRPTAQAPGTFDLYFDGQPVMWNVKVTGLGGKIYEVGLSGQTDALGNEYALSAESFKVYRKRAEKKSNAKY